MRIPFSLILVLIVLALFLSGCGESNVKFSDARPIAPEPKASKPPGLISGEVEAIRSSQKEKSWDYATFRSYWSGYEAQRESFLVTLDYLTSPQFDWVAFTNDFINDTTMRPSLQNFKLWGFILEIVQNKVFDSQQVPVALWWELTFAAPRPLGMQQLLESRKKYQVPYSEETLAHLIRVMAVRRSRSLGTSIWLNFLEVLKLEVAQGRIWAEFLQNDDPVKDPAGNVTAPPFWTSLFDSFPEKKAEFMQARARALEALLQER